MKAKRTYNLPEELLERVKQAVERDHKAASQDALVEMALSDFMLKLDELEAAKRWEKAAHDVEWQAEMKQIGEELDQLTPPLPPY